MNPGLVVGRFSTSASFCRWGAMSVFVSGGPGRRRRERFRSQRGAVVVEFALVAPLLIAFLLGIVTGGLAYNRSISLNNAARETARYGATRPVGSDLNAWLNTVADVAVAAAGGDLNSTVSGQRVCVAYVYPKGSSVQDMTIRLIEQGGVRTKTTGQTCFTDARPDDERRVQVEVQRRSTFEAMFFSRDLVLDAHSLARFERSPQ